MRLAHLAAALALVASPSLAQRVGPSSPQMPNVMSGAPPMTGMPEIGASNPSAPRPAQAAPAAPGRPEIRPGATVHRGSRGEEVVVNPPLPLDTGISGPLPMSTPDQIAADQRARDRAAAERRAQAARQQPPQQRVPAQPGPATQVPQGLEPQAAHPQQAQRGCASGGSLEQLLSPECLDVLRTLRPGAPSPTATFGLGAPAAAVAAPPQGISCSVAVHTLGAQGIMANGSMATFQAPSLPHCFLIGSRLSFGVPSLTNITAVDPNAGVVAVTCRRERTDPTAVACAAQPAPGVGAR